MDRPATYGLRAMMLLAMHLDPGTTIKKRLTETQWRCVIGPQLYDDDEDRDHSGPQDYRATIAAAWLAIFSKENRESDTVSLKVEALLGLLELAWFFICDLDAEAAAADAGIGEGDMDGGWDDMPEVLDFLLAHAGSAVTRPDLYAVSPDWADDGSESPLD